MFSLLIYHSEYYSQHPGHFSNTELRRKLSVLLIGCILYSVVQIPLSFVLNSDCWTDYLIIISLNLCFLIFFMIKSRYTWQLRIKFRLPYIILIVLVMISSHQMTLNFLYIENTGRLAASHIQAWSALLLFSIVDWFYARKRFLIVDESLERELPISVVSSRLYNVV